MSEVSEKLEEYKEEQLSYHDIADKDVDIIDNALDQLDRYDKLEKENKRFREALNNISEYVRWGIQYRYIARDALEGDSSLDITFPPGMAFDKNGEPVTDYGPEHDPEIAKTKKDQQ